MKKLLSVALILALVMTLFAGCNVAEKLGEISKDKELTFDDLSLTVPGLYLDLTETVGNDALSFVYGIGDTAVLGLKEARTEVTAVMPEVDTAKEYAELFLDANGVETEITEKDGIVTFTYSASASGQNFTYLCGAFANDENFWVVQAYSYTENFKENEADFWNILKSVKV